MKESYEYDGSEPCTVFGAKLTGTTNSTLFDPGKPYFKVEVLVNFEDETYVVPIVIRTTNNTLDCLDPSNALEEGTFDYELKDDKSPEYTVYAACYESIFCDLLERLVMEDASLHQDQEEQDFNKDTGPRGYILGLPIR